MFPLHAGVPLAPEPGWHSTVICAQAHLDATARRCWPERAAGQLGPLRSGPQGGGTWAAVAGGGGKGSQGKIREAALSSILCVSFRGGSVSCIFRFYLGLSEFRWLTRLLTDGLAGSLMAQVLPESLGCHTHTGRHWLHATGKAIVERSRSIVVSTCMRTFYALLAKPMVFASGRLPTPTNNPPATGQREHFPNCRLTVSMHPSRTGAPAALALALLACAMAPPALASTGSAPPPPPSPVGISFNSTQGDTMVLQQAPAKACVYGMLGEGGTAAMVSMTSSSDPGLGALEVAARLTDDGTGWKACLAPQNAGGDFTITATCTGCINTTAAVLNNVTFGDVWYCGGQSNM